VVGGGGVCQVHAVAVIAVAVARVEVEQVAAQKRQDKAVGVAEDVTSRRSARGWARTTSSGSDG